MIKHIVQAAVSPHRGQSERAATAAGPRRQQGSSDLLNDTSAKRTFANRGYTVWGQRQSLLFAHIAFALY